MRNPNRRMVVMGLAAGALSACEAVPYVPAKTKTATANVSGSRVKAAPAVAKLRANQTNPTQVWAFDGTVPGAGVRVTQGTRLRRRFVNALPQDSTIHWHGIRIDNTMDGVPGLTQDAVPQGGTFQYDFEVADAGTFWYHPHSNSFEQLSRGLSAPLIVKEKQPPDVDADLALMINHWVLDSNNQISGYGPGKNAPGPTSSHLTVNGAPTLVWETRQNERLRLRLINATAARVLRLRGAGFEGQIMALDGMPLAQPRRFSGITLAPAQRVDLIVDVTAQDGETAYLRDEFGDVLVALPVAGQASRSARPVAAPLPPNRESALVMQGARRVDVVMRGGQMGALSAARVMGADEPLGRSALIARGLSWSINGVAGMPTDPLADVGLGETVVLRVRNTNGLAHAMHLHGTHFRQVLGSGFGPLRDTILIGPNATMDIAFVADNPGSWMFHCHMLDHSVSGMMSWIKVSA